MLWTDALFITVDDVARLDGGAAQVVTDESISGSGNYSYIRGAIEEATQELTKMSVAFGGYLSTGDVSPNHTAAVLNIGLGNAVRYKALPSQVVVSGIGPFSSNHIKQWATAYAVMYLYRNASNRTVKDRYEAKMRFFKSELDRRLRPSIIGLGLPLVIQPIAAPAAIFERNSGTWGASNLSPISQTGPAGGTFDVAITYVNQGQPLGFNASQNNWQSFRVTGFNADATKYVSSLLPGNAESNPSTTLTTTVAADHVLGVSIASLTPPNGYQDPSTRILCVVIPLAATGWNVYVGPSGGVLTLQNATPIPIWTTSYQLALNPTTTGVPVGVGQYADRVLSMSPTRQRA